MNLPVLFATPECAPLAKTGGLGDVSAALPAALRALGVDARVLLPGYNSVLSADPQAPVVASFSLFGHGVALRESHLPNGVPLIIVDSPTLYGRPGGPYQRADGIDWEDNFLRFGVLSRVAALLGTKASPLKWRPEVVHANDWQTALAPVYLRYSPPTHAASVMTIHNLAFQGVFPPFAVPALDLPAPSLGLEGLEYYGQVSFLKGGLVYADAITTVSPTYAREIQTEELGFGLDGVLQLRRGALYGVRNGIDMVLWDPRADPHLPAPYGPDTLERKLGNKRALKRRLNLDGPDDIPLLGVVSRLAHQKGIDVIADAAGRLAKLPVQVVVLGTGDSELVGRLRSAQAHHPQAIAPQIGFDEDLAHLIEAGADIFLMPSRFEPCGMNQMYSQRYGTPPIAHATGGLVDTIVDHNPHETSPRSTGFLIREVSARALVGGVERALDVYRDPAAWRALQRRAMAQDFGWERSAAEYRAIYERIRPTS